MKRLPATALILVLLCLVAGSPCNCQLQVGVSRRQATSGAVSSNTGESASGAILVVYPKPEAVIKAASTFLIGSCPPGLHLSVNGEPVKQNAEGYFAHVVSLKPGSNAFDIGADNCERKRLVVYREQPVKPIPPGKLDVSLDSIEPGQNLGLTVGDIIPLAIRATPDAKVDAYLGERRIRLTSMFDGVNRGLAHFYGQAVQRFPSRRPDLFVGFYRVVAPDHWTNRKIRFVILLHGHRLQCQSDASITVLQQPLLAQTVHDDTVCRIGPGLSRLTPITSGIRMLIDGWQGDWMRCLLAPQHHVWIERKDLSISKVSGAVPSSPVATVNIEQGPDESRILVPLTQRLPYQINDTIAPNRLVLKIFGATADTDWITRRAEVPGNQLVGNVTWDQPAEGIYRLKVDLKRKQQWGFFASYNGTTLVLHVKAPPHIVHAEHSLSGLTLCIDPGHGGTETGAIGPSGVHESMVNLSIALRLKDLLEGEGVRVIMTRRSDSENPTLKERVATAVKSGCDLLISIHANALPDGRNPWIEHGTSTYWYQRQSLELAQRLRRALVKELGFPDFGTSYQNLALCRPSQMPSVLVEVGFMIHPDEYARLITADVQQRAASALLKGINEYLRSSGLSQADKPSGVDPG